MNINRKSKYRTDVFSLHALLHVQDNKMYLGKSGNNELALLIMNTLCILQRYNHVEVLVLFENVPGQRVNVSLCLHRMTLRRFQQSNQSIYRTALIKQTGSSNASLIKRALKEQLTFLSRCKYSLSFLLNLGFEHLRISTHSSCVLHSLPFTVSRF